MKRLISICLLLTVLLATAVSVHAAYPEIVFASGSSFAVGGTATVDLKKTAQNVMNDDSVRAEVYNAALEGNITVLWKCANGLDRYGKSITWTADDVGKEYFCRINFYSDKECSNFVGYTDSDPFVISGSQASTDTNEEPQITTQTLPEATVGVDYYVKLQCTDPDASFGEHFNPGKANDLSKTGLLLTQHGELEGKPTKAGTYTFCVCAVGENGEGYMTYTLVVKEAEAADPPEPPTEPPTEPTTEPTDPTEPSEPTEPVTDPTEEPETAVPSETSPQEDGEGRNNNKDDGAVLIFVAVGLGVLIIGMVVAIVVLLKKKH